MAVPSYNAPDIPNIGGQIAQLGQNIATGLQQMTENAYRRASAAREAQYAQIAQQRAMVEAESVARTKEEYMQSKAIKAYSASNIYAQLVATNKLATDAEKSGDPVALSNIYQSTNKMFGVGPETLTNPQMAVNGGIIQEALRDHEDAAKMLDYLQDIGNRPVTINGKTVLVKDVASAVKGDASFRAGFNNMGTAESRREFVRLTGNEFYIASNNMIYANEDAAYGNALMVKVRDGAAQPSVLADYDRRLQAAAISRESLSGIAGQMGVSLNSATNVMLFENALKSYKKTHPEEFERGVRTSSREFSNDDKLAVLEYMGEYNQINTKYGPEVAALTASYYTPGSDISDLGEKSAVVKRAFGDKSGTILTAAGSIDNASRIAQMAMTTQTVTDAKGQQVQVIAPNQDAVDWLTREASNLNSPIAGAMEVGDFDMISRNMAVDLGTKRLRNEVMTAASLMIPPPSKKALESGDAPPTGAHAQLMAYIDTAPVSELAVLSEKPDLLKLDNPGQAAKNHVRLQRQAMNAQETANAWFADYGAQTLAMHSVVSQAIALTTTPETEVTKTTGTEAGDQAFVAADAPPPVNEKLTQKQRFDVSVNMTQATGALAAQKNVKMLSEQLWQATGGDPEKFVMGLQAYRGILTQNGFTPESAQAYVGALQQVKAPQIEIDMMAKGGAPDGSLEKYGEELAKSGRAEYTSTKGEKGTLTLSSTGAVQIEMEDGTVKAAPAIVSERVLKGKRAYEAGVLHDKYGISPSLASAIMNEYDVMNIDNPEEALLSANKLVEFSTSKLNEQSGYLVFPQELSEVLESTMLTMQDAGKRGRGYISDLKLANIYIERLGAFISRGDALGSTIDTKASVAETRSVELLRPIYERWASASDEDKINFMYSYMQHADAYIMAEAQPAQSRTWYGSSQEKLGALYLSFPGRETNFLQVNAKDAGLREAIKSAKNIMSGVLHGYVHNPERKDAPYDIYVVSPDSGGRIIASTDAGGDLADFTVWGESLKTGAAEPLALRNMGIKVDDSGTSAKVFEPAREWFGRPMARSVLSHPSNRNVFMQAKEKRGLFTKLRTELIDSVNPLAGATASPSADSVLTDDFKNTPAMSFVWPE